MYKWLYLINLFILTLLLPAYCLANQKALLLQVNGPIGPATQDYIQRGLNTAQQEKAALVILQLDTPGGLDSAMRMINQAILSSSVPVVTYVSPSGARAASAGTYILYASHLAAMAPGTNIGAATPIHFLSDDQGKSSTPLSTADKKAVNDAAAYLHSLAELRGRNVDWTNAAVKQSASISAEEAKRLHVIDIIALNTTDLLKNVNGHTVSVQGINQKINSNQLDIETLAPDWRYQFLSFITNPAIAYILMLIAIYGLFFELSNPGMVFPGVVGTIALLLYLYAFQLMPINYVGLTLLLVGIAFMAFEVFVSSFGVIGLGGIAAFIIGSVMLFDVNDPNYQLALNLVVCMSAISITFFIVMLNMAFRAHKRAVVTGKEGLIGSEGIVLSVMNEQITVRVAGEIWEARSPMMLENGQHIRVTGITGLVLLVEPIR